MSSVSRNHLQFSIIAIIIGRWKNCFIRIGGKCQFTFFSIRSLKVFLKSGNKKLSLRSLQQIFDAGLLKTKMLNQQKMQQFQIHFFVLKMMQTSSSFHSL